ncbi:hypothetical protein QBC47DRAFT_395968 [Echria macrotheca]|uniref:HNH nuclease domain-containing protein n=1 Tax=Echria macrotheca TaxID=438768 RepID=A0AAJ0F5M4_9PEZI|nr:hypothetical protein QBC47DRAFT_395968 [Echria macrotheca]
MEQATAKLGAEVVDKILAAAIADPDTMCRIADDISPPTEPVHDYIADVDTRCALLEELRPFCYNQEIMLNATVFAAFMIAPIPEIRNFLQTVRNFSRPALVVRGILGLAADAIRAYIPKESRAPVAAATPSAAVPTVILDEPGMPVPSGLVTRSGFSDQVKDRDGHVCVFSGMRDPQAAHIFPFATSEKKKFAALNELLTALWGPEKSMAWRRNFEDAGITQSAKNGISMNHQIRFWFDNARFALKPLRETPEGIVVQWHWLKKSILKPLTYISLDDNNNNNILHQAGVMDQSWGNNLAHRESGVRIQTGQTFLLRADEAEDKPSWDLLQMQWDLLRVAAICGAADVTDDYYDYEHLDERGYDEAVAAKQRAILVEFEASDRGAPPFCYGCIPPP